MLLFSTILEIKDTMTKDDFIRLVIEWNQGTPHSENSIPNIQWNGERNVKYGKDGLWLDIEEYRNKNIIAVRYEKKVDDGTIWDTDYVMDFNKRKMSIRLDRSYTEEALETNPSFSTPYFIKLLIDRGYLKDDKKLPIQYTETVINADNLNLILDVINGKSRYRLPIVYISKTYYDEDPVNVSLLAKRLKGVAHVLLEEGNILNQAIRKQCDGNNEYYGAIGVYYPSRGMGHQRFLYRSAAGYDSFLFDKVCRAIINYSNAQMVDALFTWQGVNNALLRDKLISQRAERLEAEEARKNAETELTQLLDNLDEEKRRIHKQELENANALIEKFDDDMQNLQEQIEALTRENEALTYENQGLRTKLNSRESVPVLFMGYESELYQGEIKDLLLATLSEVAKNIQAKSRRADVIRDIIKSNDYQKLSITKAEEIKRLLKNYDGMSSRTRQALKDFGFTITEEGKHYKLTYYGDGRYQTAFSKTPSDVRTGKNCAQEIINLML